MMNLSIYLVDLITYNIIEILVTTPTTPQVNFKENYLDRWEHSLVRDYHLASDHLIYLIIFYHFLKCPNLIFISDSPLKNVNLLLLRLICQQCITCISTLSITLQNIGNNFQNSLGLIFKLWIPVVLSCQIACNLQNIRNHSIFKSLLNKVEPGICMSENVWESLEINKNKSFNFLLLVKNSYYSWKTSRIIYTELRR